MRVGPVHRTTFARGFHGSIAHYSGSATAVIGMHVSSDGHTTGIERPVPVTATDSRTASSASDARSSRADEASPKRTTNGQAGMDVERRENIRLLRDSAAALATRADLSRARRCRFLEPGLDREAWRQMGELGWLGLRIPEEQGGSGLGMLELVALAEELGSALAPEPFVAGTFAIGMLSGAEREAAMAGERLILPAWQEAPRELISRGYRTTFLGGRVSGRKLFVPLAAGADAFVVATSEGCALVAADAEGVRIQTILAQDGSHWGTIEFDGAPGEPTGGDPANGLDEAVLASAGYLLGLMDAALEQTLGYLSTRRQFGVPIGTFQALQHRVVDLRLQAALTRASVEEAALLFDTGASAIQRRAAASRAKARASDAAMLLTRQAIQLHGAIGYTDEHDIGLYLRKAMVLAPFFGSAAVHRQRYARAVDGEVKPTACVDGDANSHGEPRAEGAPGSYQPDDFNALEDEVFRKLVRSFLEQHHPPELRNPIKRLHWADARQWYMRLSDQGWLAPGWPREHGGMGLSAAKQLIYVDEFESFGAARTPDHGIMLLGPLLIRYGTEAQKSHFLPKILSGEHIWCQGYSEPNAGSDLAALRTQAVLDGDHWVVNGQKTWTTLANDANWMFLLVRTDSSVKKQEGISFLLVPMNSRGVTVRPIVNLDMQDEFCEVFLDDVHVPRDYLVGEMNKGWTMAKALLGFERIFLGSPRQSAHALTRLERLARHVAVENEPAFRDRYTQLRFDLADHMALFESFADKLRRGEQLGADVSLLKIHQSELFQRISELMLEIGGEEATYLEPIEGNRDLNPTGVFLTARAATIYGGASEVQRNIIAKNVLRLPG